MNSSSNQKSLINAVFGQDRRFEQTERGGSRRLSARSSDVFECWQTASRSARSFKVKTPVTSPCPSAAYTSLQPDDALREVASQPDDVRRKDAVDPVSIQFLETEIDVSNVEAARHYLFTPPHTRQG